MVDESPRDIADKKLTPKQRLFVESYCSNGFNATQAAITAGYSETTAYSQGSRLLKDVEIKAAVDQFFDENTMQAKEVLSRLSDHARGDVGDYMTDKGSIDWVSAKGKTHLIKKVKRRTETRRDKSGEETVILDEEIELHSPQFALNLLGKQHGLFSDKQEHSGDIAIRLVREPSFNRKPQISETDE